MQESVLAVPLDQIPLGEGKDPEGKPAEFFVDRNALNQYRDQGPQWKYEDARFIPEAITEPDAIFAGLGRPNEDGSFCYAVRLTHDPDEAASGPPRYGMAFVVFVKRVFGYVVFDWGWREEDPDCPGHPMEWKKDFQERKWHRS
jgi:hypothetical protein